MANIVPIKSSFKSENQVDDGWCLDVDDGWFLDEEPGPYHEYVVEVATTASGDACDERAPKPNRRRMYGFVFGSVAPMLKRPS